MSVTDVVVKVGSIAGLFSLLYLVADNRRRRPKLMFQLESQRAEQCVRNGLQYFEWTFEGLLKNVSPDPNTLARIHLVVWQDRKRNNVLRHGWGGITAFDRAGNRELPLPISLGPRDAKNVRVRCDAELIGTRDLELLNTKVPIPGTDPALHLPKYRYELCLEDVLENVFDMNGDLCDPRERDLRWLRPNAVQAREEGARLAVIQHDLKIAAARIKFVLRRCACTLGLVR